MQLEIPSNKTRVFPGVDILSRDAAITNRCQKTRYQGKARAGKNVIERIDANEFALGTTFSISITYERPRCVEEFYLKLGPFALQLRNAAAFFFLSKPTLFFLSFSRLFLCCFSLFVFLTLFILRGSLANARVKFDSSTHSRKNAVENIARFT